MAGGIITERKGKLLTELAQGFRDGHCRLLETEWLDENSVSLGECMGISALTGDVLNGFLRLGPQLQMAIVLLGLDSDRDLSVDAVVFAAVREETLERLKSVSLVDR